MIGAEIKLDAKEVTDWLKKDRSSSIRNYLTNVGIQSEKILRDEVLKISAGGQLEKSIQRDITIERGGGSTEIYSLLKYADIALEFGRAPGRMPPVQAIERWVVRRGGDRTKAYIIARNIARSGTKKYRRKGPKLYTRALEKVNQLLDTKEQELLRAYD